jgi:hypothetical protein
MVATLIRFAISLWLPLFVCFVFSLAIFRLCRVRTSPSRSDHSSKRFAFRVLFRVKWDDCLGRHKDEGGMEKIFPVFHGIFHIRFGQRKPRIAGAV